MQGDVLASQAELAANGLVNDLQQAHGHPCLAVSDQPLEDP